MGQSSAEACSQASSSPEDWSDDVVQKLAGINHHHVWSTWSRDRDTERLDEHGLVTLPQAAVLVDQGRRDWTQFKLEDIGYINACAAAPRLTAFLSNSIVLTFFFIVLWN